MTRRNFSLSLTLLVILSLSTTSSLYAENWPNWRGPKNNGVSGEKNLPAEWNADKNVAWRLPLPGRAGATPVIWGDRIFLTTVADNDLILMCIGTNGEVIWQQKMGEGNSLSRSDEGDSASPSPSTDGEHVWAMVTPGERNAYTGVLGCYTVDGKEVWTVNVHERYGMFQIQFGMSSTPVLHGDRLYLQLIHGDGNAETQEALIVAIDKMTGDEVWRTGRPSDGIAENEQSYASPVIYDYGNLQLLLTHGADYIVAHDLNDGSEVWRCGGLNPKNDTVRRYDPTLRFVASPAAVEGMIVVPTAKAGPVVALKPNYKGDITDNTEAHIWTHNRTPDVPSPVIYDGITYLCMENGNLHAVDSKTGEQYYEARTTADRHRASPVYADGKLFLTSRGGIVTVVKTGKTFEILSQNPLEEEMSASPAIADGTIYLRTFDALWAIREK
ncbi:MAG: PQQ-binding-like beta-propeller repeat protein [Planctomycetota bacterium]|nr:PQQ-binding-like beta-propeller repeat protein [Planctomycetota bacterium]MDA1214791.1 PQQ-binding-like beta-propeller repeat protein [Planctomycetota bacterium]